MKYDDIKELLKLEMITIKEANDLMVEYGYRNEEGKPIKCQYCESNIITECVIDCIDGHLVCEKRYICGNCGSLLGDWAYGSYIPEFEKGDFYDDDDTTYTVRFTK